MTGMQEQKRIGLSDFLMLLAVLLWAVNFTVVKIALREFSPHQFNGLRLLSASLILLVVLKAKGERLNLKKEDLVRIFAVSIVGNTIYQVLFIKGINLTTASTTSLIMAMTPVFIALLSSYLKYEKLHWASWLGIAVSFAGFYFVITNQAGSFHFSSPAFKGDLMIFVGNICWAAYTVFSKPLLKDFSPLKLTTVTLSIGTLFYLPAAAGELAGLRWGDISPAAWAALGYSSLFAIVISFVIWYFSVQKVGNSKTGIYGNITPVFAVIIAYLFLGETISSVQALGAVVIIAGVYLTRSGYRWFEKRKIEVQGTP